MAWCCSCNSEGARCVRCVCVKKNCSCSSCCPKKIDTCRNLKPTLNQATSGQSSSSLCLSTCLSLKSIPFDSPSALTDVFVMLLLHLGLLPPLPGCLSLQVLIQCLVYLLCLRLLIFQLCLPYATFPKALEILGLVCCQMSLRWLWTILLMLMAGVSC